MKIVIKRTKQKATRDGYGEGLLELGRKNEKIVVLCADLKSSTRCSYFAKEFPERFVQVGVAEQNMASLAVGMAQEGYIPFISSFAVFSPGRNWEQIRSSICYSKANVKIASSHAGVSTGADGATHQALEDIAIVRVIPNIIVLVPCDAVEAKKATIASADVLGPVYIRLAREETSIITGDRDKFEIGKVKIVERGSDVSIISCGPVLSCAIEARNILKRAYKIKAEIINCHTIKPIDEKSIIFSAKKTGCVVTVEEHQISGGLGGAVAEVLSEKYPVPMKFVGMPDSFGESGKPCELFEKYGITSGKIVQSCVAVVAKKRSLE